MTSAPRAAQTKGGCTGVRAPPLALSQLQPQGAQSMKKARGAGAGAIVLGLSGAETTTRRCRFQRPRAPRRAPHCWCRQIARLSPVRHLLASPVGDGNGGEERADAQRNKGVPASVTVRLSKEGVPVTLLQAPLGALFDIW